MRYKIEAISTRKGNIITFKVYRRKGWKYFGFWKFMCNVGTIEGARILIKNMILIEECGDEI